MKQGVKWAGKAGPELVAGGKNGGMEDGIKGKGGGREGGTGRSGKIGFFYNSLQPLPRLHRCKRPSKLSTQ